MAGIDDSRWVKSCEVPLRRLRMLSGLACMPGAGALHRQRRILEAEEEGAQRSRIVLLSQQEDDVC